ncbi:hypothetical protein [Sphingomonas montana]|uniref:hypothetical protein n=1 Tax=Sphingomonas montana TaxID=1843236 RepID=UPI00096D1E87|nr:hypothetical protein [Sphingomonas montana]
MTQDQERRLLADYVETCRRLDAGFRRSCDQVAPLMPMSADAIAALPAEREDHVLSFLKRFEQYADTLNRTLKTIAQIMELGRVERLTARDIANRADKFGITDADLWSEAIRTRNALAHEYPLRPDKQAEQINAAWRAHDTLNTTLAQIEIFVRTEGLSS